MDKNRHREIFKKSLITVGCLFIPAIVQMFLLSSIETSNLWILFYPAIIIVAYYCGFLYGLVATGIVCVSVLFGLHFFNFALFLPSKSALLGFVLFVFNCLLTVLIIKKLHKDKLQADVATENEARLKNYFELLFNINPDAVTITRISDGLIVEINNNCSKLFGYERNEIVGKNTLEIHLWNDKAERVRFVQLIHENGGCEGFESILCRKDGTLFWALMSVSLITINDEAHILAVTRDITERKSAEELSKKQEDFLRILTDNIPGMIAYWNNDYICEFSNEAYSDWYNKTQDDMIGIGMKDLMGEELFERNKPHIDKVFDGHKEDFERILVKHDGDIRYTWAHYIPNIQHDVVKGFYVLVTDITELKRTENALQKLSTRLMLAAKAGGVGVWDYNPETNRLFWDAQMYALYGITQEGFVGAYETWLKGVHRDDMERNADEIQKALRGEKDYDTEFRVVWPDGSVHSIRALAMVQRNELGIALNMIGTNWDITGQKQTEERLVQNSEQLIKKNNELDNALMNAEIAFAKANEKTIEAEMVNKSKSMFLANMSHEIRTPLNAIIGFSQLMNRDKHLNTTQREYNLSIIRAGENLMDLINDILELSKVEAGKLLINATDLDLYAFFDDIKVIFKERTQNKHIDFGFEISDDVPNFVFIDQSKLRQIFINLVGNAVKFTDKGGVKVIVTTEKGSNNQTVLLVDIHDTGPGIKEQELKDLFKPFVQTSTGINKGSGTGLGLALSRELARLMGGDISVTTEVGKGSTFRFAIAIVDVTYMVCKKAESNRIIGVEKGQKRFKILVVDDKEENVSVVIDLLSLVGFDTNEAVNGQDAITKFHIWNPDLIIMDIRMPVMDGFEATRQIKMTDRGKHIPIIALTASIYDDENNVTKLYGMQGYIRKPFKENDLLKMIGDILGVTYLYEDLNHQPSISYSQDKEKIVSDILLLPEFLVNRMLNAIAIADIDTFLALNEQTCQTSFELADYFESLASKFDYIHLHQLLMAKNIES